MKTTKKQKKSNLKVSLLLLLLAAVLLISSTYAWFIANNTATISTINVKVETVEGIQISVDAQAWKNTITNADITGAGSTYTAAVNQLPGILKPVSSGAQSANVTSSQLDMFDVTAVDSTETSGSNVGRKKMVATKTTDTHGTTGNYITFDVFFNLQSTEAKDLYITPNSKVVWDSVRAGSDANTAYQTDKGLQNASRIAFMVFNNATTADATTAQGWTYSDGSANSAFVLWEPNADAHTTAAIENAVVDAPYDVPHMNRADLEGESKKVPLPYSGVKAAFDAEQNVYYWNATAANYASNLQAITPQIATNAANATRQKLVTLKPGVTKMRIYMWIEGQDIDCYTGASGTYLNWDLQFEVDTAAST